MRFQRRRVSSQQLVEAGEEEGRLLPGFSDITLVAGLYDPGDVVTHDRKGIALDQHARKITRGQTDYRIVTRVREQLNLYTFHPAIQPQDLSAPKGVAITEARSKCGAQLQAV